jgi:beta-glucosidase
VHPMGFGLSYTSFEYSNVTIAEPSVPPCTEVAISVNVLNNGTLDGDEVVQVYVTYPTTTPNTIITPIRALRAFTRVTIPSGYTTTQTLTLSAESFTLVDESGFRQVIPGVYTVYIGGQQPNQQGSGKSCGQEPLQATVTVTGTTITPYNSCPGVIG